ncbi:MAG: Nramp family divalent metal transporter [Solirubrobacteraceae bacterium]
MGAPEPRPRCSGARLPVRPLATLGPAFVAAIAYVDPGNFATNVLAGAEFGYALVWVVIAANLMAMLVQSLSAKLGLATGRNLAELCRERFPRRLALGLWVQAEVMAMATDLAELVGGAVALNLLLGIALFPAGVITAIATLAILSVQTGNRKRYEAVIAGMLAALVLAFLYETIVTGGHFGGLAAGLLPSLPRGEAVLLATGILGATVMPHTIYLHSALTQDQATADRDRQQRLLRLQHADVLSAMSTAGLVNVLMLVAAAGSFFAAGLTHVNTLTGAHHAFHATVGSAAALTFALALLVSGLASSTVGTYAGQVVMQGFTERELSLTFRRLVTMAPALILLAAGAEPSRALVLSQVVLSFGIPFALIPLLLFTQSRKLMGPLVNGPLTITLSWLVAGLIVSLNMLLLAVTFSLVRG